MEIIIIEKGKSKISFEVRGESHTLCNALKDELRQDKSVKVASYYVAHPDIDEPTFTVEAADPVKAVLNAVNRIKKQNDNFLKVFQKEVK